MNKKVFFLYLLLVISYTYSALPGRPNRSELDFNYALQVARDGSIAPLSILTQENNFSSRERQELLKRLILTGNIHNITAYFFLRMVSGEDITPRILGYAQQRCLYNAGNIAIFYKLLEIKEQHRRNEEIKAKQKQLERKRKRDTLDDDLQGLQETRKLITQEPETCRICLEEYTDENPPERMVPESDTCKHTAHKDCFKQWCKSAETDGCIFCNNGSKKRHLPMRWMQTMFG